MALTSTYISDPLPLKSICNQIDLEALMTFSSIFVAWAPRSNLNNCGTNFLLFEYKEFVEMLLQKKKKRLFFVFFAETF